MSFSFGAAAAPAPAAGGFAFGAAPAAAAAPAPAAGGFAFGATPATPAAAPVAGGFGFGATPAAAPAPVAGGFGFGAAAPAPVAGGFGFGATPAAAAAPAPVAGGFGFGTPAAAPAAGGFGFGATPLAAPAPVAGGFGFGTPAAAPPAAVAFSLGGLVPGLSTPGQGLSAVLAISGNTPYSALPENVKRVVDSIHQSMLLHRQTMENVKSMAPALLAIPAPSNGAAADAAAGPPSPSKSGSPLPVEISKLEFELQLLASQVQAAMKNAKDLEQSSQSSAESAYLYAKWPVEALAVRRGVQLPSSQRQPSAAQTVDKTQDEMKRKLTHLLQRQAANVDRVERIPSPYMWTQLHTFQLKLTTLQTSLQTLKKQLLITNTNASNTQQMTTSQQMTSIVKSHNEEFLRIAEHIAKSHDKLDYIRFQIHKSSKEDPFKAADIHEAMEDQKLHQKVQLAVAKVQPPPDNPAAPIAPVGGLAGGGLFTQTAPIAPVTGGLFGAKPPTSGLFGATAPIATPAPAFGAPAPSFGGGGLFGSPAAAAPTAAAPGGLFGAAPAAAAPGGLFGAATPTPAAGGLFGATAAPAFGAVSTPKTKSKSRMGRSRR